jgi:hypothetical protein
MIKNQKKLIFLIVFALIVGSSTLFTTKYLSSFSEVTIKPPSGTMVSIYKSAGGGEENLKYDKPAIVETSQRITQKIKKGSYVYVVTPPNSDYKTLTSPIGITDKAASITPKLELSNAKLAAIANSERTNAQNILKNKYPKTMINYTVDKIQAYDTSDWIGVSLKPNSANLDTSVAIFKMDKGQLKLATIPTIVLSQPVYPNIPLDVIDATNRLAQIF